MRTLEIKRYVAQTARTDVGFGQAIMVVLFLSVVTLPAAAPIVARDSQLTPLQLKIEQQRRRLNSSETEERREAVLRLGWMKRQESARVAANGLHDSAAIVRATGARAVIALPPDKAAALLLPNLQDRDEFVRQETAYALGEIRNRAAVASLLTLLE